MIIGEILGEDGASLHHESYTADLSSKAELAALLAVADNLLHLNPVWRTVVHNLSAYAQKSGRHQFICKHSEMKISCEPWRELPLGIWVICLHC
jgi:hypothetical protein